MRTLITVIVLAVLIAPGTLLVFFNWGDSSEWVPIVLAIIVSGAYYYFLVRFIRKPAATGKDAQ